MALLTGAPTKSTPSKSAAKGKGAADAPAAAAKTTFEADPGAESTGGAAAAAVSETATATTTAAAAPVAASSGSLAAPAKMGGAIALPTKMVDVLGPLKDALRVDYNTLAQLQVNQGNWLVKEGKKMLGDTIDFELLSFQDNYVISPGVDGDEALEFVKYSADGITTDDGLDVKEYLTQLRDELGYEKASMKQRTVLVLNLLGSSANGVEAYYDKLYQVDLAPTSKTKFDAHRAQVSFSVTRGKRDPADCTRIRSSCSVVEKGKNSWTVASFDFIPAE